MSQPTPPAYADTTDVRAAAVLAASDTLKAVGDIAAATGRERAAILTLVVSELTDVLHAIVNRCGHCRQRQQRFGDPDKRCWRHRIEDTEDPK